MEGKGEREERRNYVGQEAGTRRGGGPAEGKCREVQHTAEETSAQGGSGCGGGGLAVPGTTEKSSELRVPGTISKLWLSPASQNCANTCTCTRPFTPVTAP